MLRNRMIFNEDARVKIPDLFRVAVARLNPGIENDDGVVLIDASGLGTKVKEGKNQKTVLSKDEEHRIVTTFNAKDVVEDFLVVVSYEEITAKNYSLSAGQYFDVKIEYVDLTPEEFAEKLQGFSDNLEQMFKESGELEDEIRKQLAGLRYG